MKQDDLKERTKKFALSVINVIEALSKTVTGKAITNQLIRASTSVAANYRAACRSKSTKDFIYKLGIVEEETDESLYWMELLIESGIVAASRLSDLMVEGNKILAIIVSSIKTAKSRSKK